MEGYFRSRHKKIKIGSVPLGQIASHIQSAFLLRQIYKPKQQYHLFKKEEKKKNQYHFILFYFMPISISLNIETMA